MTFTSASYALFLPCVALLYFCVPRWLPRGGARAQNAVLLAASVCFCLSYCKKSNFFLPILVLAASTVFTFWMARGLARAQGKKRRALLAAALCACVGVLAFFKYFNYAVPSLLGDALSGGLKLALPVGISFYTFAVISYLVDVYRGDLPACESFLNYAAFVSFFATLTSGPICRAQKLLPQLAAERRFDAQRACDALRLMLFGFFKQIAIANVLGLYVNQIFRSSEALASYSGFTLLFAACLYALELYFEFAGYSEIARGTALLLGLEVPVNFKTPYFATNFSGLWSRWHISLTTWLQDYIFMPLVWSRWTSRLPLIGKKISKPPMISSVALVFILSGFWHGSTLPFVVWGCLQALYRVGEELLHQWYRKPAKKPKPLVRFCKSAAVFCLWSASLVFFRVGLMEDGTVRDGFSLLGRQFTGFSLSRFAAETSAAVQAGFYTKPFMVTVYFAFLLFVLFLGGLADWKQCFQEKDRPISLALARQKAWVRWACYYVLIGCILAAYVMQSGGFGTVSFAYANF